MEDDVSLNPYKLSEINLPKVNLPSNERVKSKSMFSCKQGKNEEPQYQCQQCEVKVRTAGGLYHHIVAKHKGACYPCKQCDYKAERKDS